jgi:DNA-binding response OmpR family regulator
MRILIIEDEVKLANAIKRALELKKYVVEIASNGTTGLDLAVGEEFDLIILDRMLPHINGIEICQKIRKAEIHTPILILTAKGEIENRAEGLDAGADDYMVKPFSFVELFARVRALMRRPQKMNKSVLKVKDLTLDTLKFKVKRGNKSIKLSSKEFSILEYLMRHKNVVLTKMQIISHVWNYNANVLENSVEVHIKHLRDKIDTPFSSTLIHTVRGVGYAIKEEGENV